MNNMETQIWNKENQMETVDFLKYLQNDDFSASTPHSTNVVMPPQQKAHFYQKNYKDPGQKSATLQVTQKQDFAQQMYGYHQPEQQQYPLVSCMQFPYSQVSSQQWISSPPNMPDAQLAASHCNPALDHVQLQVNKETRSNISTFVHPDTSLDSQPFDEYYAQALDNACDFAADMYVGPKIIRNAANDNHSYIALQQACDDFNANANVPVNGQIPQGAQQNVCDFAADMYVGPKMISNATIENHSYQALQQACYDADANVPVSAQTPQAAQQTAFDFAAVMCKNPKNIRTAVNGNHSYPALQQACDDFNADANVPVSAKTPDSITRSKHLFTDKEALYLEQVFVEDKSPDREKCEKLAKDLHVPRDKVYNWFKNRRKRKSRFDHIRLAEGDSQHRRYRTTFTPTQLQTLTDTFNKKKHLETDELEQLAQKLELKPVIVKNWFKNKRNGSKKKNITNKSQH
jgi:hypothetical protein